MLQRPSVKINVKKYFSTLFRSQSCVQLDVFVLRRLGSGDRGRWDE